MTSYSPIPGYKAWSFNVFVEGKVGTFTVRPGVQLALVRPDKPNDPVALGTATSNEGYTRFTPSMVDVSNATTGAFFWRFGVFYKSGGALASADVDLETFIEERGDVIGNQQVLVQPYTIATGEVTIHPVTGWIPTLSLDAVKAAIVVMFNLSNKLQNRLYVRYTNDRHASPTDWIPLEAGWSNPAGGEPSSRSTGAVSLGAMSYTYAQFALGVQSSNGSAIRADIHVALASILA